MAIPEVFVVAVLAGENVALAPPALGTAVKVTVAPLTGLPPESTTVAESNVLKAVLIAAVCGVPPVAVMVAAEPAVLVREKAAGVVTPDTLAFTM